MVHYFTLPSNVNLNLNRSSPNLNTNSTSNTFLTNSTYHERPLRPSSHYRQWSVSMSGIDERDENDEMLNADNANLRERVYELERKVQSQEDELVCLRSSTADLLRRLTILEQSKRPRLNNSTPSNANNSVFARLSATSHSAERPRNFSQSTYNLRSLNSAGSSALSTKDRRQISPSPIRRTSIGNGAITNGYNHETPPSRTVTIPRRYVKNSGSPSKNNLVNVPMGRSARGSPMRKWMSHVDVKDSSGSSSSITLNNGSKTNLAQSRSNLHTNNAASSIASSTTNLNNSSLHKAKSSFRIGSLSSLAVSHRLLSQIGYNVRDPIYLSEQRVLQVFIRGKPVSLTVPNSVGSVNPLREIDAPKEAPQLDWVNGYRGRDSRSNLHQLPTGELIYFTGAVVVLHNPDDQSQRHYLQHTSEVKCIAIHPNKLYVATGQTSRHSPEKKILNEHRSPICSPDELTNVLGAEQTQAHIRIWDSITLHTLRVLGTNDASFEKGISCVSFSRFDGGTLLAAVDDSYEHTLSVWEWHKSKRLTETKSANDQVFACEFHPQLKNLIIAAGKGHFNFWFFDGSTLSKKPALFDGRDKPKHVLSICFADNGYVISGDSNGTIAAWDPKIVKVVNQAFRVHEGGVWALCLLNNGHIVSGGKDGILAEWSVPDLIKMHSYSSLPDDAGIIRTIAPAAGSALLVGTTRNAILRGNMNTGFEYILQGHAEELWALCAHPLLAQFLTGSIDGTLRLWDSLSKSIVWSMQVQDGISCVDFHPSGNCFAVGTPIGSWIVYDTTNREALNTIAEPSKAISTLRFSPDGKSIAVATKESHFYLYAISENLEYYIKSAEFSGFTPYITTMDWSTDSVLIRTNTSEFEQHIWNTTTGALAETSLIRAAEWSTSRCMVSFENGCITQTLPGIMAIERSPDSASVAVAIDNGAIRFYQYPTTTVTAMYGEIFGHSPFIANIAFLPSRLISIGAKDSAIFHWRL